jgi:FlaA1/EpsC-like NDP-sugar epimerase
MSVNYNVVFGVITVRILASRFILHDYSLSWSKASQRTFLIKSFVYAVAFVIYMPFYYGKIDISFMVSELLLYLFSINFLMYVYYSYINKSTIEKTKRAVIYGAGRAGIKLESEFSNSEYRVECFLDDDKAVQNSSIDSLEIFSAEKFKKNCQKKYDLLVIAIPSAQKSRIKEIYDELGGCFYKIQVLPSFDEILQDQAFSKQLKAISLEDLLARHPKDLDTKRIAAFLKDKIVLVTGAGGSIGSEICQQCQKYGAKKLILVDNSEYNLYNISESLDDMDSISCMVSVVERDLLEKVFEKYTPEIVIHAAAYKHVPLVEANIDAAIVNNIIGTKNVIDLSIAYGVEKVVVISTDKAVRPTNVMGTTKRICELYAQNSNAQNTDIVAVRFGNVLGSSGSVIPKFKKQIELGGPITVTHPEITRYFMLIPEACELVLQAAAIGHGGEIFILDMGEPVKIVDLAKKMAQLSGREDIEIVFTGLRPGEKLYEELLINESDATTDYASITVAKPTQYDLKRLNSDIEELLNCDDKIAKLKAIVPEFEHKLNQNGEV